MKQGFRTIEGLISARTCARPGHIPKGRPRGVKAMGVRYERELARAIPTAVHGQWFQFVDKNGPGHCQTDLLLKTELGLFVLEVKYSWTPAGHLQVSKLYRPVVEKALGQRVWSIQVCRRLTQDTPRHFVRTDLRAALVLAAGGSPAVLHWIGGSLVPLQLG